MFPRVTKVHHIKNYLLEISFSDGMVSRIDLRESIVGRGGVFEPLQSVEFFRRVSVDREAGTLVWPNGVDFCPNVLYSKATGKSIAELGTDLEVA